MEEEYTEPNLCEYFIQAYPDRTLITNAFAVQNRSTNVCRHYAVLMVRMFIEGSVEGVCQGFKELFGDDTLTRFNDQLILDIVPLKSSGAVLMTLLISN